MLDRLYMGIDIGTSQSKGVLCNAAGSVLAQSVREHDTVCLGQGRFEHDPEAIWYAELCAISCELIAQSGVEPQQVKGLGISAIGPCVLPLDSEMKPLRNAILYGIDTRSGEEIAWLNAKYGEQTIAKSCGNSLSSQAAGAKILWIRNHEPEIFDKTRVFVTSTTYLVYKLTGRCVMDYYTACAGYSPLYDFDRMAWSETFCQDIGGTQRLPELAWSSDEAGRLTPEAAKDMGLEAGVTVAVGTADAAAEAVSVGVTQPGRTMLMLGSTGFIIAVGSQPVYNPQLWCAPYLFPGTYSLVAGTNCAGGLTKWFFKTLRPELEGLEENPYAIMAQEAQNAPAGAGGLVLLPYFSGERTPINDPNAKGVLLGMTLSTTRNELYRAVLEGVGYAIADNLSAIKESGISLHDLRTVGGGAKSKLWLQIISDITGIDQTIHQVTIGASYGDCFIAAMAAGDQKEPVGMDAWLRPLQTVRPNIDNAQVYHQGFQKYKDLYRSTKALM